MSIFTSPHPTFHLALLAGLVLAASTASAASQCKGMQESSCMAAAECIWVNGYTRKDGRSVASHCKLKGGKRSEPQARADSVRLGKAD